MALISLVPHGGTVRDTPLDNRWFWRLIGLVLTLALGIAAGCTPHPPFNANETLDFSSWEPEATSSIVLSTEWRFLPEDLDPRWITEALPDDALAGRVPGSWVGIEGLGGYGTFALNIVLPEAPRTYGIRLRTFASAYRLYVDGEEVIGAGTPTSSLDTVELDFGPRSGTFEAAGPTRIVVQTSGFHHWPGGPSDTPRIGAPLQIQRELVRRNIVDFGILGCLLFVGFYHLTVWRLRRQDRTALTFGLLCVVLAIRVSVSDMVWTRVFGVTDFITMQRFAHMTYYLGVPLFLLYVHSTFPRRWYSRFVLLAFVVGGALCVPVLLLPSHAFAPLLQYFNPVFGVTAIATMVHMVGFVRRQEFGSRLFAFSAVVAISGAAHDILYTNNLPSFELNLAPAGMLVFVLLQATVIARRFAAAYRLSQVLTGRMQREVRAQTARLKLALSQERILHDELSATHDALSEARDELEAALEAAQMATSAKSRFLANMSHELRTPMNGIISTARLLRETPLTAEQVDAVETVISSGELLLRIINDILDFSKIEAGRLVLERAPSNLRTVVDEAMSEVVGLARRHRTELYADFPSDEFMHVFADPVRLRQILVKLLDNAVKFAVGGTVQLRVRRVDGDSYRFEVIDDGVGIEADVLARLFEEFSQADESSTRRHGGTGLGLAIASKLVQMMGGELQATSTYGEGSRFTFEVSLGREREHTFAPPCRGDQWVVYTREAWAQDFFRDAARIFGVQCLFPDGIPELDQAAIWILHGAVDPALLKGLPRDARVIVAGPDAGADGLFPISLTRLTHVLCATRSARSLGHVPPGLRVLVVDDNPINREVLGRHLHALQVSYDTATNGLTAVTMVARGSYDAVFMDCQMPVLNGFEATREIRQLAGEARETPVIAVTAGQEGERAQAHEAGMDGFLTKPLRIHELVDVLQTVATSPAKKEDDG